MEGLLPNDALSCLLSWCSRKCITQLRVVNRFFRLNVARWVIRQTMDPKNVKQFYADFARMHVRQLRRKNRTSNFDYLSFVAYLESTHFLPVFEQRVRTEPCALSMLASFCLFVTGPVHTFLNFTGHWWVEDAYRPVCIKGRRKDKDSLVPMRARFAHYDDTCVWLEHSWKLLVKRRDAEKATKRVNKLKRELEAQRESRATLEQTIKVVDEEIHKINEKANKRAKRYEDELREKGAF